jgi:hypothetical protein
MSFLIFNVFYIFKGLVSGFLALYLSNPEHKQEFSLGAGKPHIGGFKKMKCLLLMSIIIPILHPFLV